MATTKKRQPSPQTSSAGTEMLAAVACSITTRLACSQIVLDFLHGKGFADATEDSDFVHDIHVTQNARRQWGLALRDVVASRGCDPDGFGPEDCANASTVGDIVDALGGALHVA